jgi:hypothetical protein
VQEALECLLAEYKKREKSVTFETFSTDRAEVLKPKDATPISGQGTVTDIEPYDAPTT